MMVRRITLLLAAQLLLCDVAQSDPGQNQWTVWSAFSLHTIAMGSLTAAERHGRNLLLSGIRYGHLLKSTRSFSWFYTVDIIPVAVAFHTEVRDPISNEITRANIYGFGGSPIGLKFDFRTRKKVQPFFDVAGGFLKFPTSVPAPQGSRWNFSAMAGAGIQFPFRNRNAIQFEYMFHHISNARRHEHNPSLNTGTLRLGLSFFVGQN